jgi:hypothetical chaperone protein
VLAEVRGVLRDSAEPEKIERLSRVLQQHKGHELLAAVEAAKIELSGSDLVALHSGVVAIDLEVHRAELETAVADSLQRLRSRIEDVQRMAGLAAGAVSAVFLTGGATRMPCVRECIASAVPDAKLIVGDAFGSIATGLALDAGKRFGER